VHGWIGFGGTQVSRLAPPPWQGRGAQSTGATRPLHPTRRSGQRNRRLIGHPDAGWRRAVICPVVINCRRHGIDPWTYLRDALQRVSTVKQSHVPALPPRFWKPGADHPAVLRLLTNMMAINSEHAPVLGNRVMSGRLQLLMSCVISKSSW